VANVGRKWLFEMSRVSEAAFSIAKIQAAVVEAGTLV